tara:strand:+ start:1653 stop:2036 length:384 start_codon:yes stop_codon:yes gene_type:complete
MEEFQENARKYKIASTFVVGGTFGIFLTLGNAWSDFLKESIIALVPDHEHPVIHALIYALSASVFCLLALFILIRTDIYFNRLKFGSIPRLFNRKHTNVKPSEKSQKLSAGQKIKMNLKSRQDLRKT